MDVTKLMMVGVVTLGAYAAIKMLSAQKVLPGPHGEPALPTGEKIDTTGLTLLGDPLSMKKFQFYRGRLELPESRLQPVPPFNVEGDRASLLAALAALGFDQVQIFMGRDQMPSGWPAGTLRGTGEGTRFFQGRWSQEAMQLPRPGQLLLIWLTRSPGA